jgi:predicted DNA-binding transcriptional regulator YafY
MKEAVTVLYTNHRNETARRRIQPLRIWFGSTEWHPEPQWLMSATDLDKGAVRDFAMQDIREWEPDG